MLLLLYLTLQSTRVALCALHTCNAIHAFFAYILTSSPKYASISSPPSCPWRLSWPKPPPPPAPLNLYNTRCADHDECGHHSGNSLAFAPCNRSPDYDPIHPSTRLPMSSTPEESHACPPARCSQPPIPGEPELAIFIFSPCTKQCNISNKRARHGVRAGLVIRQVWKRMYGGGGDGCVQHSPTAGA